MSTPDPVEDQNQHPAESESVHQEPEVAPQETKEQNEALSQEESQPESQSTQVKDQDIPDSAQEKNSTTNITTTSPKNADQMTQQDDDFTQKDPPSSDHEHAEDDDYDPESIYAEEIAASSPPNSNSTTTTQSQPQSQSQSNISENLLQSVLSEVSKKPKEESKSPQQQPVDLSKLLSSIGSLTNSGSTNSSRPDVDAPFTDEENRDYQEFLDTEQEYIKMGRWDQFPYGSRMFVGNLPVSKITKQQLYRVFRPYGRLAQISIKQAYGFVQYFDPAHCSRAMDIEAREPLKGNMLHLEISKPQIPKRERERQREQERMERMGRDRDRSRSPRRGRNNNNYNNYNNNNRRGGNRNNGNNYNNNRNRSPRGSFGSYNNNQRTGANNAPLGSSRPRNSVPECQIFVTEQLDPEFVRYVERGFLDAGIRVEVDDLPARTSVKTAIQQMAFEGVSGVVLLEYQNQSRGTVNIQVFDKSGPNMRFDEYLHVELRVAIELINRSKRQSFSHQPPSLPSFSQPQQYPNYHQNTPPPPQAQAPNPSNLLGTLQQMDPNALQQMMQYIQQSQNMGAAGASGAPPATHSASYGGASYQPSVPGVPIPPSQYPPQAAQQSQSHPQPQSQGQSQPQGGGGSSDGGQPTQQVQNIMEQLARLQNRS